MKEEVLNSDLAGELLSSAVSVQKVTQSVESKVAAGALPLAGFAATALLGAFGGLNPWAQAVIIAVSVAAGAWLFDRSKERQLRTQLALIEKAASKHSHTVEIEPEPAKAG